MALETSEEKVPELEVDDSKQNPKGKGEVTATLLLSLATAPLVPQRKNSSSTKLLSIVESKTCGVLGSES